MQENNKTLKHSLLMTSLMLMGSLSTSFGSTASRPIETGPSVVHMKLKYIVKEDDESKIIQPGRKATRYERDMGDGDYIDPVYGTKDVEKEASLNLIYPLSGTLKNEPLARVARSVHEASRNWFRNRLDVSFNGQTVAQQFFGKYGKDADFANDFQFFKVDPKVKIDIAALVAQLPHQEFILSSNNSLQIKPMSAGSATLKDTTFLANTGCGVFSSMNGGALILIGFAHPSLCQDKEEIKIAANGKASQKSEALCAPALTSGVVVAKVATDQTLPAALARLAVSSASATAPSKVLIPKASFSIAENKSLMPKIVKHLKLGADGMMEFNINAAINDSTLDLNSLIAGLSLAKGVVKISSDKINGISNENLQAELFMQACEKETCQAGNYSFDIAEIASILKSVGTSVDEKEKRAFLKELF